MLDKLGSFTTPATPKSSTSFFATIGRHSFFAPREVVLITGTTGGLGAATLVKLVQSKSVKKVYALNRQPKSGANLLEKQRIALESRGYDPKVAAHPKVVLVAADITETGLGVEASLDREVNHVHLSTGSLVLTLNLDSQYCDTHYTHRLESRLQPQTVLIREHPQRHAYTH